MKKIQQILRLTALAALLPFSTHALQINEIRIDEPGAGDLNEFTELIGAPGTSLDDVWYIVVGDHSNFENPNQNAPNYRSGVIEYAIDLTGFTIPEDGLFLIARSNIQADIFGLSASDIDYLVPGIIFENSDNVTHMLVRGYTGDEVTIPAHQWGDLAVDIDPNDDGELVDPLPWSVILDAIGIVAIPNDATPSPDEFTYGDLLEFTDIGPDGTFAPGHVYRGNNDKEWNMGQFALINSAGDGLAEGAKDTPGSPNPDSPAPVVTPEITYYTPTTAQPGETITVTGDRFNGITSVMVGEIEATFNVIDATSLEFEVPESAVTGSVITITNAAGPETAGALLKIISSEETIVIREDFETDLGDFEPISVASNYNWRARTFNKQGFAEMNGFGADAASDDWLVSPAIVLTEGTEPLLEFITAKNFSGPDLEVKISTDFSGNVSTATWTDLQATVATDGGYALTPSGEVDLTEYEGETVRIAFRYTSLGGGSGQGATWQVHDFVIAAIYEDIPTPLWSTATDLGNGWFDTWMGMIYTAHAPYYYAPELAEWLYFDSSSTDDGAYILIISSETWIWTTADIFANYYEYTTSGGSWEYMDLN